jgi:hypothetical protein
MGGEVSDLLGKGGRRGLWGKEERETEEGDRGRTMV